MRHGDDQVWRNESVVTRYLEGVRGGIPLAEEQIGILLRLVAAARPKVESFLDVGCGDGVLGRAILSRYPEARGVFLDFSERMLKGARVKLGSAAAAHSFILRDYGQPEWVDALGTNPAFDVVVSGFSIHHQPDKRKKELYLEVFDLLKPGGLFLNLEHVASKSDWGEKLFDEYFVDSLYQNHRRTGGKRSRTEIADEYYHRDDKAANILSPLETQCAWLREIGFADVDCYFKVFELALFGGNRPMQGAPAR